MFDFLSGVTVSVKQCVDTLKKWIIKKTQRRIKPFYSVFIGGKTAMHDEELRYRKTSNLTDFERFSDDWINVGSNISHATNLTFSRTVAHKMSGAKSKKQVIRNPSIKEKITGRRLTIPLRMDDKKS